jgi:Fe-S-cluster-containing hydrogenase component 2
MENINDTPVVNYDICDGCGICIALCPGLAIFVIDESDQNGGKDKAIIKIPHEFLPPVLGDIVAGLDRRGADITRARVLKVVKTKSKTSIVWIEVPREYANDVRAIRTGK